MNRRLPTAIVFFGTCLTGCAAGGGLYLSAPPPPRYAVIGVAPGPGWVWTDGFWDRRGEQWVWVAGRWLRPPRPRAVWVPGRWTEGRSSRYKFERGHWR
jgi:hypothetical protein